MSTSRKFGILYVSCILIVLAIGSFQVFNTSSHISKEDLERDLIKALSNDPIAKKFMQGDHEYIMFTNVRYGLTGYKVLDIIHSEECSHVTHKTFRTESYEGGKPSTSINAEPG